MDQPRPTLGPFRRNQRRQDSRRRIGNGRQSVTVSKDQPKQDQWPIWSLGDTRMENGVLGRRRFDLDRPSSALLSLSRPHRPSPSPSLLLVDYRSSPPPPVPLLRVLLPWGAVCRVQDLPIDSSFPPPPSALWLPLLILCPPPWTQCPVSLSEGR